MIRAKEKLQNLIFISVIIILLFPALLVNLGLLPLTADEATRATVALEMDYSGNLLTPTINGAYYFNKPPLYNWLLLSLYKMTGSHSEWIIRTPTIISLVLFGFIIFWYVSKNTNRKTGLLSALAFITCGRILFYDSFLGLIDITFSMLIFLNFMLIYEFLRRDKYVLLFFLSWIITAVTFLMKGLPALVFEGLTLFAAFIYFKRFKKLFSPASIAAFILFIGVIGGYYYLVWQQNPTSKYFSTLLSESTKRTFMQYGFWKTFLHLFTFPFEQLYHLAPWSLLLLVFFSRKARQAVRGNHFTSYAGIIFLVNIPVYWISYETYPRYLFMLYPLLLTVLVYAYYETEPALNRWRRSADAGLLALLLLIIPTGVALFYLYPFQYEGPLTWIFAAVLLAILLIVPLFIKMKGYRLHLLVITLLVLRLGFNLVVMPERVIESRRVIQREQAESAARLAMGNCIYLAPNAACSHETTFYIERVHGTILQRHHGQYDPEAFYLFDDRDPVKEGEEILYRLETRWRNIPLRLSKMRSFGSALRDRPSKPVTERRRNDHLLLNQ